MFSKLTITLRSMLESFNIKQEKVEDQCNFKGNLQQPTSMLNYWHLSCRCYGSFQNSNMVPMSLLSLEDMSDNLLSREGNLHNSFSSFYNARHNDRRQWWCTQISYLAAFTCDDSIVYSRRLVTTNFAWYHFNLCWEQNQELVHGWQCKVSILP